MREIWSTRTNEMVDPVLQIWGWEIPVYLFLGGFVAGLLVLAGLRLRRGDLPESDSVLRWMPGLGLILLTAGMFALFLDLEHKLHVLRLYTVFEVTSPMSWGAWILVLVYPVLIAQAAIAAKIAVLIPHPVQAGSRPAAVRDVRTLVSIAHMTRELRARLAAAERILIPLGEWISAPHRLRWFGNLSLGSGIALGIYTGILLSALGARPFWNSALVGPLFLASGLSSSAAFLHLIARRRDERIHYRDIDTRALAAEAAFLLLFVLSLASAGAASRQAIALVLGGPYTTVFWVFVLGLGIVLPGIIQILAAQHRIGHTAAAPFLVLGGGLLLRFVFVWAGQASRWAH